VKNQVNSEGTTDVKETAAEAESIPWYLREDESSRLDKPIFRAEMPHLPQNSPKSLEPVLDYMINKLGLDNFKVFDVRDIEDSDLPISSFGDIMVIAQGKSEKHLQNASQDLITHLKQEHEVFPFVEGLLKPNSMVRMRRRMKRRLMNKKRTKEDEEFGVGANSWIMIDTKINNIFIHLLTPERRERLNLEYIWCKPEERDTYRPRTESRIESNGREIFDIDESDSIFSGLKRHYSTQNSLSLDDSVLRQIEVQEFDISDESALKIRSNPEMSLNILQGIITKLESSVKDSLNTSILDNYIQIFNKVFPHEPTLAHWNTRFDFHYYLQFIHLEKYMFRELTNTLKNQVASGISITEDQFSKYLKALSSSLVAEYPLKEEQLNHQTDVGLRTLFQILPVVEINRPDILNDDSIVLDILRLTTQQHLYGLVPADYTLLYQKNFNILLDFFYADGSRRPSPEIIEFALVTYLKANDIKKFFEFWESLSVISKSDENTLVLDDRPWDLLFEILLDHYKENFIDVLLHDQLPFFIQLKFPTDNQVNSTVTEILDRFDSSGGAYAEIREYFK
jgi:ribosomal silencing factor RsfS